MPTETRIGRTLLRLVTGDIAEQDTDAVVTAAHWRMNRGAGTDGTIHSKGGPAIMKLAGGWAWEWCLQDAPASFEAASKIPRGLRVRRSRRFSFEFPTCAITEGFFQ